MYTYRKRIAASLLAVCLILSLTACGGDTKKKDPGKNDSKGEDLSRMVYIPEVKELALGDKRLHAIASQDVSAVGKDIYFSGYSYSSGDENKILYPGLFHVDAETGEIRELDSFGMSTIENDDTNIQLEGVAAGADGTVWIGITTSRPIYELPVDFDEEKDDRQNYYKGSESSTVWHCVDGTGKEISSVEIREEQEIGHEGEQSDHGHRRYATLFDDDGCCYYRDEGTIYVKDPAKDTTIRIAANEVDGDMIRLGDGTIGVFSRGDKLDPTYGVALVDKVEKKLCKSYPIKGNVSGQVLPGSGKYLFFYTAGDFLYGYLDENSPAEQIFSWSGVSVTQSAARSISLLQDGRIAVLTSNDSLIAKEKSAVELVLLKQGDASALPKKEHLTLACLFLPEDLRNDIAEFNRTNTKIHIDIKEYDEGDFRLSLTKLMTEISAGNIPDMLSISNLPISQYVASGFLEDLWPYIDNDPELGRDKLMIRPLEAAQVDGKLPYIFGSFTINSEAALTENVGNKIGWSMEDLEAAMEKLPQGARAFGPISTKERLLNDLVVPTYDDFIDWSTGQCYYDSQEFVDILKFCDRYGASEEEESASSGADDVGMLQSNMQLLIKCTFFDLRGMQADRMAFNGEVTYVGMPASNGKVGSTFSGMGGVAMSSACKNKEAAWEFMRTQLLNDRSRLDGIFGFPINKELFDEYAQKQMKKHYVLDENGNKLLDKNGEPIEISLSAGYVGDVVVDLYAATQEDLDTFMEVYTATECIFNVNWDINDIIESEAQAFFQGEKTAEEVAKQIQSRMTLYINEQM